MGHGTMVASVAGTNNGVAPGAALGSYRVFGCSGYATDDILIEAIDRAVRDGCDIINLSLATGSGYADAVGAVQQEAYVAGNDLGVVAGHYHGDGQWQTHAVLWHLVQKQSFCSSVCLLLKLGRVCIRQPKSGALVDFLGCAAKRVLCQIDKA